MRRSPMLFAFLLTAFTTPIATQAMAQDCSGTVLFEDTFASLDPSWGTGGKNFASAGGKATMSLEANNYWWAWNAAWAFPANADVCVDVTLASETADPKLAAGGVMFWVKDNANF